MTDILQKHSSILEIVRESTCQVFSTMMGTNVVPGELGVETRSTIPGEGLVAMVGMAGAVSGSGSLCLSKKMACFVASRFLMAEYEEVNDDVLDAVAELSNMIVGGLKTSLEEQLGPMGLSVPTIVFGDNYITRSPSLGERMRVVFRCDDPDMQEEFLVLVCLVPEAKNRSYLQELAAFHANLT